MGMTTMRIIRIRDSNVLATCLGEETMEVEAFKIDVHTNLGANGLW